MAKNSDMLQSLGDIARGPRTFTPSAKAYVPSVSMSLRAPAPAARGSIKAAKQGSGDFVASEDTALGAGSLSPSRGNLSPETAPARAFAPAGAAPASQPTGGDSSGPNPGGVAGVYSSGNPITPYVGGSIKL